MKKVLLIRVFINILVFSDFWNQILFLRTCVLEYIYAIDMHAEI